MKACVLTGTTKFQELKGRYNLSEDSLKSIIQKWQDKNNIAWETAFDSVIEDYVKTRVVGEPLVCRTLSMYQSYLNIADKYGKKKFKPDAVEEYVKYTNKLKSMYDEKYIHLYTEKDGTIVVTTSAPVFYKEQLIQDVKNASFDTTVDILPNSTKVTGDSMINTLKTILPKEYIHLLDIIAPSCRQVVLQLVDFPSNNVKGNIKEVADSAYVISINSSLDAGQKAKTILHELVHAGSLQILKNNPELQKALDEYTKEIANKVEEQLKKVGHPVGIPHAFADGREFIAEFFANEQFQQLLKETEPVNNKKFRSLFEEVCSFFTSLFDKVFGMKAPKSAYEQINGLLTEVLNLQSATVVNMPSILTSSTIIEMNKIKSTATANGTYMKAPNGKKSNLTQKQWLYTRTAAFKAWFGDWEKDPKNASKVIDENGEPQVVYHGSPHSGIDDFSKGKKRYNTHIGGYFFSDNKEQASTYGDNMYPVFLNLRNPAKTKYDGSLKSSQLREVENKVIADNKHDSAILDTLDKEGRALQYVAKNPNQIKSAEFNSGEFSNLDNIYYDKEDSAQGEESSTISAQDVKKKTEENKIQERKNTVIAMFKGFEDAFEPSTVREGAVYSEQTLAKLLDSTSTEGSKYKYYIALQDVPADMYLGDNKVITITINNETWQFVPTVSATAFKNGSISNKEGISEESNYAGYEFSTSFGNIVDDILRKVFKGETVNPKEVKNMTEDAAKLFIKECEDLRNIIKSQYGDDVTFFTEDYPMVALRMQNIEGKEYLVPSIGKTDMVMMDNKGNLTIFDFKTYRSNSSFENHLPGYTVQTHYYNGILEQNLRTSNSDAIVHDPHILKVYTGDWSAIINNNSNRAELITNKDTDETILQVYGKGVNSHEVIYEGPVQNYEGHKNTDKVRPIIQLDTLAEVDALAQASLNEEVKSIIKDLADGYDVITKQYVSTEQSNSLLVGNEEIDENITTEFGRFIVQHSNSTDGVTKGKKTALSLLCSSNILSSREIKYLANSIMYKISETLDRLQNGTVQAESLGINQKTGQPWFKSTYTDKSGAIIKIGYSKMGRMELLQAVGGINYLKEYVKEVYFKTPINLKQGEQVSKKHTNLMNRGLRKEGAIEKLAFAYNYFDALMQVGYSKLISLEGVTVIPTKKSEITIDGVDAETNTEFEDGILEESDREAWQTKQVSTRASLSENMKKLLEKMYNMRLRRDTKGSLRAVALFDGLFGFVEYIHPNEAVETLLRLCHNCTTIEEMETEMREAVEADSSGKYTWIYKIIGYQEKDEKGKEVENGLNIKGILSNPGERQQFFQCFRKDFTTYSIIMSEYDKTSKTMTYKTKMVNTNVASETLISDIESKTYEGTFPLMKTVDNISGAGVVLKEVCDKLENNVKSFIKLFDTSYDDYGIRSRGKSYHLKKEDTERIATALTSLLSSFGFDSSVVTKSVVQSTIKKDTFRAKQNSTAHKIAIHLSHIVEAMQTNYDYQQNNTTDSGRLTPINPVTNSVDSSTCISVHNYYKNIATIIGNEIVTSQESSSYENGKMVYSFGNPSYINKIIKNLQDVVSTASPQKFQEFMKEEYDKYDFFVDEKIEDPYDGSAKVLSYRNAWLDVLKNSIDPRGLLDKKTLLNVDKIAYKDLSPMHHQLAILQEYFYKKVGNNNNLAWYRVPMFSNKPALEFVRFTRYAGNFRDKLGGLLQNVFMQEIIRMKAVVLNDPEINAPITNFDIATDKKQGILAKIKNNEPLTIDDFVENGKLKFGNSGASFKFLPFFNEEFIKKTPIAHAVVDYINAGRIGNSGSTMTIKEGTMTALNQGFRKALYSTEKDSNGEYVHSYMRDVENSEIEELKKLGLYEKVEVEVGGAVLDGNKIVKRGLVIPINAFKHLEKFTGYGAAKHARNVMKEFSKQIYEEYSKGANDAEGTKLAVALIKRNVEYRLANDVENVLNEFTWNNMYAAINMIQLTTTDLAFYKNAEDFQKRYAEVYSSTLKLDKYAVDKNGVRYSADGLERSITLKDQETVGDAVVAVMKIFEDNYSKTLADNNNDSNSSAVVEADILQSMIYKNFKNINITDAQAYSGTTSYKKKLAMAGRWDDAMEEAYQEILKGNYNIGNLNVLLQPIKPFVYGQMTKIHNNTPIKVPVQHKNSEYMLFIADAILRGSEQSGDSKLVALSDFMEGTAFTGRVVYRNGKFYKDNKVLTEAQSSSYKHPAKGVKYAVIEQGVYNGKGIDTAQFESAIKVGLQGVIDISDMTDYDEIMNTLVESTELKESNEVTDAHDDGFNINAVHHVDFDDYGIQQEVPAHLADHKQLHGSQMRILGITDISHGTNLSIYNSLTREYEQTAAYGDKGAINEYQDLVYGNVEDSFKELASELLLDTDSRQKEIVDSISSILNKKLNGLSTYRSTVAKYLAGLQNPNSPILTDYGNDPEIARSILSLFDEHNFLHEDLSTPENSEIRQDILDRLNNKKKDALGREITSINYTITRQARNQALSTVLKKAIQSDQRYGSDLLRACEIIDGEFTIPLGDPIQSVRVQQLINSIIKTRINRQKISGGSTVQTSCFGLSNNLHMVFKDENISDNDKTAEGKKANVLMNFDEFVKSQYNIENADIYVKGKKDVLTKYGAAYKEYLRFDTINNRERKLAVEHFECYAPIPSSDMRDALTKEDGTLMTPDEAIAAGVITEEQLKMIGYRIPTEDKYSMMPFKIVGFVPQYSGEVIIMPKEITLLTGSDFDIDKIYLMTKVFKYHKASEDKHIAIDVENVTKAYGDMLLARGMELKDVVAVLYRGTRKMIEGKSVRTELPVREYFRAMNRGESYKTKLFEEVKAFYEERKEEFTLKTTFKEAVHNPNKPTVNGRNNRLFDIQWAILTNSDTVNKSFNPGNFDTQKKMARIITIRQNGLKDDNGNIYTYDELMGKNLDELNKIADTLSYNSCLSSTQTKFFKQNMTAAKLIGIFANHNVSHGFCSLHDIYVKMPQGTTGFSLFGRTVTDTEKVKLDDMRDAKGTLISRNIAGFLAAAVDAVKDPVLNFLNLNTATASTAMTILRMGYTVEEVSVFMTQPYIIDVVNEYERRSADGYVDISTIINEKLNKNGEERMAMEKGLESNKISLDVLTSQYGEPSVEIQNNCLLVFQKLLQVSAQVNDLTFITKFNSMRNAVGPNISDTEILKRRVERFDSTQHSHNGMLENSVDVIENSKILAAFYKFPQLASESIFGGKDISNSAASDDYRSALFQQYTPAFKHIVDEIEDRMKSNLNSKDIDEICNDYILYKITIPGNDNTIDGEPNPIFNSSEEMRLFLRDFPKKFSSYIAAHPELTKTSSKKNNPLLSVIKAKGATGYCKYPTLEAQTGNFTQDVLDDIKDAWADMIKSDDPASQQMAVALFYYNMFRSGFNYSPKTFMHLAPADVKLRIPGYVQRIADPSAFDIEHDFGVNIFIDQFFRNRTTKAKFVPKFFINNKNADYKMTTTALNKDLVLTIEPKQGGSLDSFITLNTKQKVVYCPVINVGNIIYRNPIIDSKGRLQYVATTSLGIPNNFKEYNAAFRGTLRSVLVSNNENEENGATDENEVLSEAGVYRIADEYNTVLTTLFDNVSNLRALQSGEQDTLLSTEVEDAQLIFISSVLRALDPKIVAQYRTEYKTAIAERLNYLMTASSTNESLNNSVADILSKFVAYEGTQSGNITQQINKILDDYGMCKS